MGLKTSGLETSDDLESSNDSRTSRGSLEHVGTEKETRPFSYLSRERRRQEKTARVDPLVRGQAGYWHSNLRYIACWLDADSRWSPKKRRCELTAAKTARSRREFRNATVTATATPREELRRLAANFEPAIACFGYSLEAIDRTLCTAQRGRCAPPDATALSAHDVGLLPRFRAAP